MLNGSDERLTFLGRTTFRNSQRLFGIKPADRRAHIYIIGKTGTGKSTLLETLVRQDLAVGRGLALLDPHGDLVERVRACVPSSRQPDVIDFNVPDSAHPLGFNPLEPVPPAKRALAASGVLEVFKKLWADSWGPRLEHILRNALLALFDQPQSTLVDVLRLLDDPVFRREAAGRVANAQVRDFWLREYERYPASFRAEAIESATVHKLPAPNELHFHTVFAAVAQHDVRQLAAFLKLPERLIRSRSTPWRWRGIPERDVNQLSSAVAVAAGSFCFV